MDSRLQSLQASRRSCGRGVATAAVFCCLIFSSPCRARKTNYTEAHRGLYTGAGTYFHLLPNDNQFDPVPGPTPTTGTITDSAKTYLLPCRIGIFKDSPKGNFMVYAIYMMNLRSAWTVAGTPDGAGSTQFTSYGAGAEISLPVYNIDIMRMNFAINGEYVRQKARLTFIPTSGGTDILDLSTTSYLVGVGFEPELWLGDMYALSLFAGYQYGLNQTWQVAKDATFMNNPFVVGALTNPTSGSGLTSQFGGFYLAAGLKLHFQ